MTQKFDTVDVLDVPFIKATNQQFLNQLQQDINQHKNTFVVTANPEIVLSARNDKQYYNTILSADYITADGIGIIKGASILKNPLPERITGYDTMLELFKWGNNNVKKIYLIGAKPDVIEKAVKVIQDKYPNLDIVGSHDGYFSDDTAIVQDIKDKQPDMVFVALGFPKQEYFIAKNRNVCDGLWMGVGGSFDVLAGVVKRAPLSWQKHHVEWLYRLIKEPTRFVRMLALPKYLVLVWRRKLLRR